MPENSLVLACLLVEQVPALLLHASGYTSSICDYCGAAIWVAERGGLLVNAGAANKACTSCVASRMHVSDAIVELGDRNGTQWTD
jgi:hypothetical protein